MQTAERDTSRPAVDIVIPVLNEAHVLRESIAAAREFLLHGFPYEWRIVVVDNGSTDGTADVARELAASHEELTFLQLEKKGRGRALRHAWQQSRADVVCYMDVDLSTDLEELPKIVRAITENGYDIAVGSRLLKDSTVKRSLRRDLISRSYNIVLHLLLRTRFSDAQCGFKAVSRRAVDELVPRVADESWFFDTELLVIAERQGYRIKDVPVTWSEDDDSRVKIVATAWDDLKGVFRLRRQFKAEPRGAPRPVQVSRKQP